jgi:hypothetical protein
LRDAAFELGLFWRNLVTMSAIQMSDPFVSRAQSLGQSITNWKSDGTFKVEDVVPGDYAITIDWPIGISRLPPTVFFTMPAITDDSKDKPLVIPDIMLKAN